MSRRRRHALLALIPAGVFLAVGLSFQQVTSAANSRGHAAAEEPDTIGPTQGTRGRSRDRPVALGDRAPRVVILGDSVGRDVGNGLKDWATRTGEAEILNLATRGCGLAVGAWPAGSGRRAKVCDRWRTSVHEQLARFEPEVIVIMTAVWELNEREKPDWDGPRALGDPHFDAWLIEEFESTLRFLDDFDAHVVWLTAPCIVAWVEGHEEGIFDPARVTHLNGTILPALVRRNAALDVIDFFGAVCPAGRYAGRLFGIEPFRTDGIHFSKRGQRWVGDWLGPQIVEALNDAGARPSRN